MARVNCDPNYALYRQGKCIKKPAEGLLKVSGAHLSNGGGLEEVAVSGVPFRLQNCVGWFEH